MIADDNSMEWVLDLTSLTVEIDSLRRTINKLKNDEARRDLSKLLRNVEDLKDLISREAVRCRGLKQTTGTMQSLQKNVEATLALLNKMLSMALIMD